jgi:hypothetical protein
MRAWPKKGLSMGEYRLRSLSDTWAEAEQTVKNLKAGAGMGIK